MPRALAWTQGFPFADSSDPPGSPESAPTPPSFGAASPPAPRPFKSVAVEATALESAGGREYLWGAALRADSGGAGGAYALAHARTHSTARAYTALRLHGAAFELA
eukprot:6214165-Pleurochrysis_carterae.AAC.2